MPKGEKNRKLTDEQRSEIIRLYIVPQSDGTWMGVTTIARMFHVCPNAIDNYLKRTGIQKRTSREAHAHGKRCKPITNLPPSPPPFCRCGCNQPVFWCKSRKRWYIYAPSHYHQQGAMNPAWKGGMSQRDYPWDWRYISRHIRKRNNYTCQVCGLRFPKFSKSLHVHHIDGDKSNCADDNLACVCVLCHPTGSAKETRTYWLSIVNVPIGPGGR